MRSAPPLKTAPRLIAWVLRKQGFRGVCLPPFGIYAVPGSETDLRLRRHESAHWEQARRMGVIRWYVTLLWQYAKYGYWNAPLEREARSAE